MKFISHQICVVLFFFLTGMSSFGEIIAQDIPTDSVIVNLGYNYSIPEWMVTRSVSTIDASQLDKSVSTNFGAKLHGRLPGLTVSQTNNEPGLETLSLYSRGVGTFGPGRNILILVDGFESFYDQLIPEEIETVTLLKDAAAASMYGMRGANGVLLITTKRGKEGPLKINFSAQTGFESPQRLPDFLGSYDYATLYNEALRNDGLPSLYSSSDLSAYQSGSDPYFYPDVNWHEQLLRKAAQASKANLSFSGGQNNVRYFVLLNYLNRSGIYKKTADETDFSINSNYSQFIIRSNVDIDITKRLVVSANVGFSLANKSNPAAFNTNTIFNRMSLIAPNAFPVYNPDETYGGNALYTNPLGDILETGFFTSNYRTSQSALKLTHQLDMIAEGLSISAAASFNNTFRGYSSKSRTYERFSISRTPSGDVEYRKFGEPSSLVSSENQYDQWRNTTFQTSLIYRNNLGNGLIDAALGYDMSAYTLMGENTDFKHLGINGRIAYALQQKYIGELSFGYYGSNGYRKGERFGLFPGGSIGWIVSNEDFLKSNQVVNYLKLKASFGISGNNALNSPRFMYDQYYSSQGSYLFGTTSVTGYAETNIANPGLTWEKKKEINFGLDASFINCLNFNFDVFYQNRYDILALPESMIPQFGGMLTSQINVGKVDNKGFESSIGYKSMKSGDFNFFADLNIWFARNKITNIPEMQKQDQYQLSQGRRVDQPFLLQDLGFFRNESDVANAPFQIFDVVQAGDIKYKDQNNDGFVDERDFYPIGYTNLPELTLGLNVGVQYKKLYLNAFFHSVTNRSVYLSGSNFYAFQNDAKISSIALKRWTSDTHESASYPRLSSVNNMNNYQQSSFWQRDGSFVRCRNIELGYQLPDLFIKKMGITEATIFINGANIFTLDYVKIADPEILTGYPAMRSFNIGAKIQL